MVMSVEIMHEKMRSQVRAVEKRFSRRITVRLPNTRFLGCDFRWTLNAIGGNAGAFTEVRFHYFYEMKHGGR